VLLKIDLNVFELVNVTVCDLTTDSWLDGAIASWKSASSVFRAQSVIIRIE